jgi:hypothetical protein
MTFAVPLWTEAPRKTALVHAARAVSGFTVPGCFSTGALAVIAVVLGYQVYQARQKTTGVEISVGERGISIEKK